MKAPLRFLTVALLLLVPIAAYAQGPTLSPIANVTVNAGATLNVNLIAVDAQNRPVTVTGRFWASTAIRFTFSVAPAFTVTFAIGDSVGPCA